MLEKLLGNHPVCQCGRLLQDTMIVELNLRLWPDLLQAARTKLVARGLVQAQTKCRNQSLDAHQWCGADAGWLAGKGGGSKRQEGHLAARFSGRRRRARVCVL